VADKVLIEVENAMMDEDSLFVTDGLNRIYIASYPGSDSSVVYSIPLNGLKSSTHYFFSKIPKSSCEEFVFEELNGVITATSMGFGEGPWVLESRSLETGMVHSVVMNGESGFIATQEGQQLISVYDANGQLVSLKVIQGSSHTSTDNKVPISLRVYPNPSSEGSTVKAQVMGLSEQKAMTWVVNESSGKLISTQTGTGLPFFERQFSFTQQGTYIITVLQGDQLVSSKVLVIGQ
jgi:hypothetical protein